MRSEIKRIICPEIDKYLSEFTPKENDNFGVALEMYIGAERGKGEDLFHLMLCTPRWFNGYNKESDLVFIRNYLFVEEYDYDKIWKLLKDTFEIFDFDWDSIATRLSRFAYWEFEYL